MQKYHHVVINVAISGVPLAESKKGANQLIEWLGKGYRILSSVGTQNGAQYMLRKRIKEDTK